MVVYSAKLLNKPVETGFVDVNAKALGINFNSRIAVQNRISLNIHWHGLVPAGLVKRVVVPLISVSEPVLIITALDDSGIYNAVAADNVRAELMP